MSISATMASMEPTVEPPEDTTDATFAASVLKLREAKGWSQNDLARHMAIYGVRDATALLVSRIESGRRRVRLQEAIALSHVFEVPISAMASTDMIANHISLLFESEQRKEHLRDNLEREATAYARHAPTHAKAMLEVIQQLRQTALEPDVVEMVNYYERSALWTLGESPADVVADVEWERVDGEHQATT